MKPVTLRKEVQEDFAVVPDTQPLGQDFTEALVLGLGEETRRSSLVNQRGRVEATERKVTTMAVQRTGIPPLSRSSAGRGGAVPVTILPVVVVAGLS